MKHALLIALFCLLFTGCSSHSSPSGPGGGPGMQLPTPEEKLQLLDEALALTPRQKEAMLPILESEYEENSERITSLEERSGKRKMAAMRRVQEEFQVREEITRDAFADILTPEQLAQYDAMLALQKKQREQAMNERRSGGRPPRRR